MGITLDAESFNELNRLPQVFAKRMRRAAAYRHHRRAHVRPFARSTDFPPYRTP
jgi:hypothetical protein